MSILNLFRIENLILSKCLLQENGFLQEGSRGHERDIDCSAERTHSIQEQPGGLSALRCRPRYRPLSRTSTRRQGATYEHVHMLIDRRFFSLILI